jgi:hypothetical protein
MQPDLEDALVPVKWADSQIPVFRERFVAWQRRHPYKLVMEPDPNDPEWEFLTVYLERALDPMIIGDVGAIINSARTSLDIFWMLLIARHGFKPKGNTSFPIRDTAANFNNAVNVLKLEYRGTSAEIAHLKRYRAYRGGNNFLYPLHHLDILRKHHRLLILEPSVEAAQITLLNGYAYADRRNLQDKTITHRIPAKARFRPSPGNTLISSEIFLNEPSLLVSKQPAHLMLAWFVSIVRDLIERFP